jgi:HSP20 family protein
VIRILRTLKKGKIMALVRNSNWPIQEGSSPFDFFDDDRFQYSPWLRRQSLHAVNVKENEIVFEVELAAPGFDKKDFNISIDNGLLTVSAESRRLNEKKEGHHTRREFGHTSFSRSFSLPANTNEDAIQVKYEDGILKLSITKKGLLETRVKRPIEFE